VVWNSHRYHPRQSRHKKNKNIRKRPVCPRFSAQ
jgi:hypothetical protein